MHHFQYRGDHLMCEELPIERIAQEVGTPFYLYSHATLTHHFRVFDQAFADIPHLRLEQPSRVGKRACLPRATYPLSCYKT